MKIETRVGNKRVPENVAVVSTTNVAVNSEEEQAGWRFVANQRVAFEKIFMLYGILESHKEDVLTAEDIEGPSRGFITISPKLMQVTHVVDIPLVTVDTGRASGRGPDETAKVLIDEISHLEWIVQSSLCAGTTFEDPDWGCGSSC
ncbi:hypothetical protein LIER_38065 [Lithospermum erythrorhizon]|uniref:Uncharacterized protein n=1 Tax=Lithospermum erythrorhizon TaxID=34254 RepID=A0AAV3PVR0_LITER